MNTIETLTQLFREHSGRFLSGETISKHLQCSRTAVWKHIRKMKEDGYKFEAISRLGYKLIEEPNRIDPVKLTSLLTTKVFGRRLYVHDSLDSTQIAAHQWVAMGAPEGTLVIAEEQTKGKGRMGRHWHSPKGKGIWMSFVLTPPIPVHYVPQLTIVVAVALYRTIRQIFPELSAGIKWPNDLLIDGKKVSGILLESSAEDERLSHVIVGVGISANLDVEDYPEELLDKAVSLKIASGRAVDREEFIARFFAEWEQLYEHYLVSGFGAVQALWEAHSVTLQKQVSISTHGGFVEGTAIGLDELGGLIVAVPNGAGSTKPVTVYTGDMRTR
ncbi:biotin--[acetyl-CoA-carboxylase] ligase [Paenibacillus turpanensis]|uniref:biotin--[acetyl-CoA-carboxylase] ligase n=1 Tax=Paenibacillus turpanensis TaxID=2689078 RepID=UPI00140E6E97|nr:biotin--[acetyl-CoA-carboxylase] ligase [Paenibacillus turpanensis]